MKFILGKKMEMTQIWADDKVFAVTPVKAGPCVISQVKTKEKDGYEALQLAFGERKEKNIKKPQQGHFKLSGVKPAHVKEFKIDSASEIKTGDVITADTFVAGETINVCGTSKGRGFQGVVKRHGFHGFRKTHGNKDQERMPGSIGPKGPAHVFKGTRMGGRMGGDRVTTTNLEIISVDEENDIIFIKGSVPGAINGLVQITAQGELKVNSKKAEVKEEPKEEVVAEVKEEVKEEKEVENKEDKAEEIKEETKAEAK